MPSRATQSPFFRRSISRSSLQQPGSGSLPRRNEGAAGDPAAPLSPYGCSMSFTDLVQDAKPALVMPSAMLRVHSAGAPAMPN
jgi:hypothetical protein